MASLTGMLKRLVREHADEEAGERGTAYAAVLRADISDVANDVGFESDVADAEELDGVIGAVLVQLDGQSIVHLFRDEEALENGWNRAISTVGG